MRARGVERRDDAPTVPTAPAKSAGLPSSGTSSAMNRTLSVRNSKLSSREKNDVERGSE